MLAYFGVKRRSAAWIRHWLVPICGIVVVLAVFSGMSALAVKVGSAWLAAGLVYGLVLKAKHRDELHVSAVVRAAARAGESDAVLRRMHRRALAGVAAVIVGVVGAQPFEAAVHPEILFGDAADLRLQQAIEAFDVADRIGAREILETPGR